MMRTHNFLSSLSVSILLATACGLARTPTAPPAPPQVPSLALSSIPAQTSIPSPVPAQVTAGPTLSPDQFQPRPTATLAAGGTSVKDGLYRNDDYGVTVQSPSGWLLRAETDPSQGGLEWFQSSDLVVTSILFYTGMGDQGLEAAAKSINDSSLSNLADSTVLTNEAVTLKNGQAAWSTIVTAKYSDGSQGKVSLTTIVGGAHTFTLLVYSTPTEYDRRQAEIEQLTGSLAYIGQSLYGIPRSQVLVLSGGESTNPREYDPATANGGGDGLVFTGLVSLNPQLQLIPEIAESWTITDGTIYTFHLRPNAKFHNGRPVTAQDFIYSWERAADPALASDTALTYLGDIVGLREMQEGQAQHISGLKAIDDHTLQVTIDAPKPYFLLKLTFPTSVVLDRANVESGPDWFRTPNGTGPYRLIRWDKQQEMIYERNDEYYLGTPAIPYVIIRLYAGSDLRLYETGDVDIAYVGAYQAPRFQQPEEPLHTQLLQSVNMCTNFITLDNTQPPFDDLKVRQAFTLAFDRQKYLDVLYNGRGLPAAGLFPPGMPGYDAGLKSPPFDPAQARQLLAESKYGGADNLPPILFTTGGYGNDIGPSVSALAQMWQDNLGVKISIENLEPDRYIDETYAGHHGQITSGGWCADYPDPENFANILFHTGSKQNQSHYSNPQIDALIDQAGVEPDPDKRIQLYQQVQQQIVNDAPVIFTSHSQSYVLVKPYIKGFVLTPIGVPIDRYLSIDTSQLK